MAWTVLVINGPNLNMLGTRQPQIYGHTTLADIEQAITERAVTHGITTICVQSNHEGVLIDEIHAHGPTADGVIINAGAFTHYSYAIRDALAMLPCPVIEVHISNIHTREPFRHQSVLAPIVRGQIVGLGWHGYILALDSLAAQIAEGEVPA